MTPIPAAFALLPFLLAAAPAVAQEGPLQAPPAVETFEYVIQPGDTCSRIARLHFGDRRRWDLIHEFNPRLGPKLPHRLVPGETLILPRAVPGDGDRPAARVTEMHETVEARRPTDESWNAAWVGLGLYRDWRVHTLDTSTAELTFRDLTVLRMRPETLVIVYGETAGRARRRTSRARLESGALRTRLAEIAGVRAVVEGPTSETRLSGGEALLSVDEAGTSRIANHDGQPAVVVATDVKSKPVRVRAGMGTRVDRGQAPTPPRPLPATPAWTAGPRVFATFGGAGGDIAAEWAPVTGAAAYRVEVAREPDGTGVVAVAQTPASTLRFEARSFPPGTWFARVAAVDDDRFESRPSAAVELQVAAIELVPPGPPGSKLAAGGETTVLPGTTVAAPDGWLCSAGAEADAAERLTLTEPGTHDLRCRKGDAGWSAPQTLTVARATLRRIGDAPVRVGPTVEIRFEADPAVPLDAVARPIDGVRISQLRPHPDGGWAFDLTSSRAGPIDIVWATPTDGPLPLSNPLRVDTVVPAPTPITATPAADAPDAARPPTRAVGAEMLGRLPAPGRTGARDEQRRGHRLWLGFDTPRVNAASALRWVPSGEVDLMDGRLRLGLGQPIQVRPAHDALSGDAHHRTRVELSGVAVERHGMLGLGWSLAGWVPLTGDADARLAPALDLSLGGGERTWALRTRQGFEGTPDSEGARLWTSGYAAELALVHWASVSLEGALSLGSIDGDDRRSAQLGVGAWLHALAGGAAGPEIGLLPRVALTEDAVDALGRFSLLVVIGYAFEPGPH